jgi:hypothetical protein
MATNIKPTVPIKTATMGTQVKFETPTESAGTQVNIKTPTRSAGTLVKFGTPTESAGTQVNFETPTESAGTQVNFKTPTESAGTQVNFKTPTRSAGTLVKFERIGIKKYFKPVEEETIAIGPVEEPRQEKVIRYGNKINRSTEQLVMPQKPAFEEPTENISFAIAEPNIESLPPTPPQPARKLTELEKLNIRYERAFGKPYSGDPGSIKEKDYRKMIQDQETMQKNKKLEEKRIRKEAQEQKKEEKARKKQEGKKPK